MADDKFARPYRSPEPVRRDSRFSTPSAPPESDPLAELARLIGQSDPFAEFGRSSPAADQHPSRDRERHAPTPPLALEPRRTPLSAYETMQFEARHDERMRGDAPAQYVDHPFPASDYAQEPQPAAYAADDRFVDAQMARHEPDHFAADEPFSHQHADYAQQPDYAQHPDYGQQPGLPQHGGDYHPGIEDDAIYDDPPRTRRRGALFTTVLLIGCAVVGTAAAYSYRSYSVARSTQTPPVITADTTPNKVVAAAADAQGGKAIQERLGDQGANERIVPRQEDPVQLKDPSTAPRVILPSPMTSSAPSTVPPASAQRPGSPASPTASSEPKKVRTVTIRPDGSDGGARPLTPTAPPSVAPVASRPAATVPAKPAARGGPLSLDPQASQAGEPAQSAPISRTASIPPAAPTRLTPAPAASGTGGYVVQLSSQRSEADAQASFRSLQAKFPTVLGNRDVIVKRADLGPKGTYFRAVVGPFASSGDAEHFCGSLKAAGGQCIIQKN